MGPICWLDKKSSASATEPRAAGRPGRVVPPLVADPVVLHLACLFPQHGAGKKHERDVALEPWQWALVARAPWAFLRGCIRSDGCVFVNRTGPYEYLSYGFANHSAQILETFVATCTLVGLRPRRYARHARLNRREDVNRLVEHVGIKA